MTQVMRVYSHVYISLRADEIKLWLTPSGKQCQNPCSGLPAVYPDLSMHHDWPVTKDLCFVCRDRLRLAERISYGVWTGIEQKEQKSEREREWPRLAKRSGKKPLRQSKHSLN